MGVDLKSSEQSASATIASGVGKRLVCIYDHCVASRKPFNGTQQRASQSTTSLALSGLSPLPLCLLKGRISFGCFCGSSEGPFFTTESILTVKMNAGEQGGSRELENREGKCVGSKYLGICSQR